MSSASHRANPKPSRQPISRKKRIVFILGAVAISIILVLSLEGILRLFNSGGYNTILKPIKDPAGGEVIITDSLGSASFFYANRSKPGSIYESTFREPKPKGLIRVMFLGESAAKGFPQPYGLASSAFLQA